MAAALYNHAGFERNSNGASDVDAGNGAARAAGETGFRIAGENKARQLIAFLETCGGQPHHAGMPAIIGHHDDRTALFMAERCLSLEGGRIDDTHFNALTLAVKQ